MTDAKFDYDVFISYSRENLGFAKKLEARLRAYRPPAGLGLPRLIYPSIQVNIAAGEPPPPGNNGAQYLKIPFNTTIADLLREDD